MPHSALLQSHLRLKVKARLSQWSYRSYINAPPPLLLVEYLRARNQEIHLKNLTVSKWCIMQYQIHNLEDILGFFLRKKEQVWPFVRSEEQ